MNFASDITEKLQTPCGCCPASRHFNSNQDRLRSKKQCISPSVSVTMTPAIISKGSNYAIGDYLTINGGSGDPAMLLYVSDVSAGAIISVQMANSPVYTLLPPTIASSTAVSGIGSGAVFSIGVTDTCCVGQQSGIADLAS